VSDRTLLGLTLALAAGYFGFSFASTGFYQHDEVGHYIGMRQFWHDPASALGNWAKPGYKLLYAPFALLGPTAVALLNSLVAAGCAFAAAKTAQRLGVATPLLAFALLAFQPLWVGLAFRNYAELPTALLLILAVWMHHDGRRVLAALALSYAVTIRQELLPVWGLYGAWLLWRRHWTAAAMLPVFPILINLWGWAATGDPLHLLHATTGQGSALADAYPRLGFWHYPRTALVVFGATALASLVTYLVLAGRRRVPWHPFVLVPLGLYTAAHVAFQIQAVPIGPSTGGNLRYLTVMGPLVAVLGAVAAERIGREDWKRVGVALGALVLVTALFLSRRDNGVTLTDDASAMPLLTVLAAAAALLLPRTPRQRLAAVTGAAVLTAFLMVRPFPRTQEDETITRTAQWFKERSFFSREGYLLVSHPLFHYTMGLAPGDYAVPARPATGAEIRKAPPGSIVVWDSHYSYRPNQRTDDLAHTDLLADTLNYRLLAEPFVAPDGSFGALVFEKRR
jgi:hypothetical protein